MILHTYSYNGKDFPPLKATDPQLWENPPFILELLLFYPNCGNQSDHYNLFWVSSITVKVVTHWAFRAIWIILGKGVKDGKILSKWTSDLTHTNHAEPLRWLSILCPAKWIWCSMSYRSNAALIALAHARASSSSVGRRDVHVAMQ